MSDKINDLDLENIGGASGDRIASRGTVEIPGSHGAGAVKALFNPKNRFRVIIAIGAGLIVCSAAVYAYISTTSDDAKAVGGGVTDGGSLRSGRSAKPSTLQKEEAARYNDEGLKKAQETDPTAHPVMLTEEDDGNPYVPQRKFDKPDRLSSAGNQKNEAGPSSEQSVVPKKNVTVVYSKETQDLVKRLIDNEIEDPVMDSGSWTYATAKASQEASDPSRKSATKVSDSEGSVNMDGELANKCEHPVVRAGRQYMARATMAYNSDVGGPVIVEMLNGPLRKHRLRGKAERKEEWVRMTFDTLFGNDDPRRIEAIGLDTETALNAVSGDVDYHTLYRYGWWGVGATLSALGKAAQSNTNTDTVFVGDNVVQNTTKDTSREIKMAVGDLGESIGDVFKGRIDRPLTVTLKVNDTVGVVFMDDVCGDK
ncbi:DotG/IcmE/VirB10 family protein [Pseudomonas sp. UMAB-40]|uniref:DotG/IcmE/VirB10 family protein n=1 Tax=Pseudomonas sp. UMAB-40 TaxID=1365407 RepID=UPI001C559E2B|nr:DotG/IcmE/VirB10 family protein [Pseudomonas sp. UMAB-40]